MPETGSEFWSPLPWDSEFFGFPIGRLTARCDAPALAATAVADARAAGLRCLYWLVPAGNPLLPPAAQDLGFRFVDLRLDFRLAPVEPGAPSAGIRSARADDLPALRDLAGDTLRDTRFGKDPGFAPDRVAALYARWIDRDFAENHILVAPDEQDRPVGLVTCSRSTSGEGRIGLFAVHPAQAGQGLGRRLLDTARSWFATEDCAAVHVATQASNVAAQRAYQAQGFRTISADLWFHLWI